METTIAGKQVKLNEQGYLTDLNEWSREVAAALAAEEGVELGEEHWPVLEYL
tara:strand:- start:120796 stop:120951 length:156 start_codon:yes stop_codon:yes gene_type:complete